MSGSYGPAMQRDRPTADEPGQDEDHSAPADQGPIDEQRTILDRAGLILAPVLIAALTGLWLLHRLSLDLDNAQIQLRSILAWENSLQPQLIAHLQIAFASTLIVILVAVPLGILLTRPGLRRISPAVLTVANSGQALPAFGLLIIALTFTGQGKITVIWALALYALLPVLRNTLVGLDGVDRAVIEAGRGMGMSKLGALTRIELPLAVPVIVAGIRTAVTINIGMATLAFLIGGGALGAPLFAAIQLNVDAAVISVAWLVAIVALTFDWLGAVAEKYLHPRGL